MKNNQKKVPAKRIQLVDVVLERKGSQLFSGRRVRSPEDAANIIRDFIGDSDREKFVVLGLSTKNEPQLLQVVHTGSINASIVHPREVYRAELRYATENGRRVMQLNIADLEGTKETSQVPLDGIATDSLPRFKRRRR